MSAALRILLIEDSRALARVLRPALREAGHGVDWVTTLTDARACLSEERYDLLLLAKQLPDGDGLSFLSGLRSQGLRIPVIAVYGESDEPQERIACLKAGADHCVSAPIDLPELLAWIAAAARRIKIRGGPA
ncbi:response regulator transcription factor [Limibacillus halophilus]